MRNIVYLFYALFIMIAFFLLRTLFLQSIEIDGDIVAYLNVINGDIKEGDAFEPGSMLIFSIIGLTPVSFHFTLLFLFCFLIAITEGWFVIKKCKLPIFWLAFFTIGILPFAHAINLRTGFGIFLLLCFTFFRQGIGIFFLPLFHSSLTPILLGWKNRFGKFTTYIVILISLVGVLVLYKIASAKLVVYYSYLNFDLSFLGILAELVTLAAFYYFFRKVYQITKGSWTKVYYIFMVAAFLTLPMAMVSTRIVTFTYVVLLLLAFDAQLKPLSKNNFLHMFNLFFFISLGLVLIIFRIYRVTTMFGILPPI
ncbi:hypothetical protein AAHN97_22940 [Chitinophaga niabensis]|uniref:hypothetical protein n=1 Tax=Chitinophaga niabensis TaxID=536979 RepID=UPI0031BAEA99